MVRGTWVQSQVTSYQRLLKWYWIPPCLTLSNIRYVSRVKWSNPGKGVAPSPTPWCSSYWKWSLLAALDYGCQQQLYIYIYIYTLIFEYIYIYIYIYIYHILYCISIWKNISALNNFIFGYKYIYFSVNISFILIKYFFDLLIRFLFIHFIFYPRYKTIQDIRLLIG